MWENFWCVHNLPRQRIISLCTYEQFSILVCLEACRPWGCRGLCGKIIGAFIIYLDYSLFQYVWAIFNISLSLQACRPWGCRGCHGAMAPPDFGKSVNPISTRRDRLCPPHYCCHPGIFRPSYGPVYSSCFCAKLFYWYFSGLKNRQMAT